MKSPSVPFSAQGVLPLSAWPATLLCCPLISTSGPGRCRVRWGAGLQGLRQPVTPATSLELCLSLLPETVIWWLTAALGLTLLAALGFSTWETGSASWSPQLTSYFPFKESTGGRWEEVWRKGGGHLSLQRPHLFCKSCGFRSGNACVQISISPLSRVSSWTSCFPLQVSSSPSVK